MSSLLKEFVGKIDLIYIDPPFATGSDFSIKIQVGDAEWTKEPSSIEDKVYHDTWGQGLDSYLQMMYDRLILMRELLSDKGSVYIHLDWRVNYVVRMLIDELFGKNNFQREIIWAFDTKSGYKTLTDNWIRSHDTILFASKNSIDKTFNKEYVAYSKEYLDRFNNIDKDNRRYRADRGSGVKQYLDELKGIPVSDVWADIMSFQQNATAAEYIGYATKNEKRY